MTLSKALDDKPCQPGHPNRVQITTRSEDRVPRTGGQSARTGGQSAKNQGQSAKKSRT